MEEKKEPPWGEVPDREKDFHLWSAKKWSFVTPPMRPAPEDLAFYEEALLESKPAAGGTALILGATPELRSLALKFGLRPAGCDVDADFWQAMTYLRTVEGEEDFIHGDWLDLPAVPRYDIILADCSLTMLEWKKMEVFVPRLRAMLKRGGISVQRIQHANDRLTMEHIVPALESYRRDDSSMSISLYLTFLVESLRNSYHPRMTYREFNEAFVLPHLTPDEAGRLRPMLVDRRFFYPPRKNFMALLEESFVVSRIRECTGPGVWGTAEMVVLGPRDK